jgi:hypothetical protein
MSSRLVHLPLAALEQRAQGLERQIVGNGAGDVGEIENQIIFDQFRHGLEGAPVLALLHQPVSIGALSVVGFRRRRQFLARDEDIAIAAMVLGEEILPLGVGGRGCARVLAIGVIGFARGRFGDGILGRGEARLRADEEDHCIAGLDVVFQLLEKGSAASGEIPLFADRQPLAHEHARHFAPLEPKLARNGRDEDAEVPLAGHDAGVDHSIVGRARVPKSRPPAASRKSADAFVEFRIII